MATNVKASRVLILSLAVAVLVSVGVYAHLGNLRPLLPLPLAKTDVCAPLPSNITSIGPALSVAQVEATSIAEMRASPNNPPKVPFGHNNPEWVALKRLIQPGDAVHEFQTTVSGGHLVLRHRCYIGQITSWVR